MVEEARLRQEGREQSAEGGRTVAMATTIAKSVRKLFHTIIIFRLRFSGPSFSYVERSQARERVRGTDTLNTAYTVGHTIFSTLYSVGKLDKK
jgi:hypothetical protein